MRIAVVGSGIAGLSCAWALARSHEVTLYEAGDYLGGHTHTVEVTLEGTRHPVDTGFLVFNRRTYPHLTRLFEHLDVPIAASDMSLAVSVESPDVEWSGSNLNTLFAQRGNLLRPAFWGMLRDILRFNRQTTALAKSGADLALPLGAWLDAQGYGAAFRNWYLLPMAAAIWSCPAAEMLAYPVATFVRFCHNHGLLQITDRPQWLTVAGGARQYVARMAAGLNDIRMSCPVHGLERGNEGVKLLSAGGSETFDEVVLACHSDQALAILGSEATQREIDLLGAIRYQSNRAYVHTDTTLLPRRHATWSAWNYLSRSDAPSDRAVSVSYLINKLQPTPFTRPLIVSLNPPAPPHPASVLREIEYAHPVFDTAAIEAQRALPQIQGIKRTWFAGAWAGYGFHEDGLRAGLAVANLLGERAPWQGEDAVSPPPDRTPRPLREEQPA
jgi:predicted NAD/FAD-binding protein